MIRGGDDKDPGGADGLGLPGVIDQPMGLLWRSAGKVGELMAPRQGRGRMEATHSRYGDSSGSKGDGRSSRRASPGSVRAGALLIRSHSCCPEASSRN